METTNPYESPLQSAPEALAGPSEPAFASRRWVAVGVLLFALPSAALGAYLNWYFDDPYWADAPQYYTPQTTPELILLCTLFATLLGVPAGVFGAILGVVFYRVHRLIR